MHFFSVILCAVFAGTALASPTSEQSVHSQVAELMKEIRESNARNMESIQKDTESLFLNLKDSSEHVEIKEKELLNGPSEKELKSCSQTISRAWGLQAWEEMAQEPSLSGKEISERLQAISLNISSHGNPIHKIKELSILAKLGDKSAEKEIQRILSNLAETLGMPAGEISDIASFNPDITNESIAKSVFLEIGKGMEYFSIKEMVDTSSSDEALSWLEKEIPEGNNTYFPGECVSCRDFAIDDVRSCCINDGLLIDLNVLPCSAEEKGLANKYYRENYCIYLGSKNNRISLEDILPGNAGESIGFNYSQSKIYMCFKSPIGKALHLKQVDRKIPWFPRLSTMIYEGSEKMRTRKSFSKKELMELIEHTTNNDNEEGFWKWHQK